MSAWLVLPLLIVLAIVAAVPVVIMRYADPPEKPPAPFEPDIDIGPKKRRYEGMLLSPVIDDLDARLSKLEGKE